MFTFSSQFGFRLLSSFLISSFFGNFFEPTEQFFLQVYYWLLLECTERRTKKTKQKQKQKKNKQKNKKTKKKKKIPRRSG